MYCKKCGRKMKDGKTYCEYCGQGKDDKVLTGDKKKDAVAQTDYGSIGAMCIIMSIFFPVIGLVMSIIYLSTMHRNKTTGNKELGKKRFIISIIIAASWSVIPILIGLVSLIIAALRIKG